MPLQPKVSDVPRIRSGLKFYRVTSLITGTFLLLLVLMMVFRYIFMVDIELAGPFGFLYLRPKEQITAVNLSTAILIAHGWFYVLYLISVFTLWSRMRWAYSRLFFMALGGVVPLLSFILERRYHAIAIEQLARLETPQPAEATH